MMTRRTLAQRLEVFHANYSVCEGSGCWIWTKSLGGNGYGSFSLNGRVLGAHQASFEIHHGRPANGFTLHSCDNPACVNPAHLREGTHQQNMIEMVSRGRGAEQQKTHCCNGHPFDDRNTHLFVKGHRSKRICRKCSCERTAAYKARKAA